MTRLSKPLAVPAAGLLLAASTANAFVPGLRGATPAELPAATRAVPASGLQAPLCAAGVAVAAVAAAAAVSRPPAQRRAARVLRRAAEEAAEEEAPPAPKVLDGPVAIPFLGPPGYRSFISNVAGDAGFDPAGFAKDAKTFKSMQEAEIKHCRLAMLAAAGWPIAELVQPGLAKSWGLQSDLAPGGLSPSVLNGGLVGGDPAIGIFVTTFLLVAAIVDLSKFPDDPPGDYGFDPLGLKGFVPPVIGGSIPKGRQWTAEAEIQNGRTAMIAITAYAFQEYATKVPVVDETPFLFKAPL